MLMNVHVFAVVASNSQGLHLVVRMNYSERKPSITKWEIHTINIHIFLDIGHLFVYKQQEGQDFCVNTIQKSLQRVRLL